MTDAAESAGIDTATWWRIEKGETKSPSIDTVRAIARVLQVGSDDLFHDEDATEPPEAPREVGAVGSRLPPRPVAVKQVEAG